MADRPILFSGPMVRAILDGSKVQTRRALAGRAEVPEWINAFGFSTFTPDGHISGRGTHPELGPGEKFYRCRYGVPGDRLWVRETHAIVPASAYRASVEPGGERVAHRVSTDGYDWAIYREGWERVAPARWRPSIHMPRWASRITLEVTEVRVERVQAITDEEARAEGCAVLPSKSWEGVPWTDRDRFQHVWDEINARRGFGWDANPWVWVVAFRRVDA